MPKTRHLLNGTAGTPETGPARKRSNVPVVLTLFFVLAGLIYFSAAPLLRNFDPKFHWLTAARSMSASGHVIYLSENTAAHFRSVGGNYEQLTSPWKSYFAARKMSVSTITDLKDLGSNSRATLILPSAVSLATDEREQILAFHNRGGSILSTWATGSWSPPAQWVGWDFLNSLGGNVTGDSGTGLSKFLLVQGETPVTFSIDAGERIPLLSATEKILLFKGGPSSAGRLVNWERLAEPGIADTNSIVQFNEATDKKGRVVLFGFSENSWSAAPEKIFPLIDNSLSWLMHRPAIVLADWPNAYAAAQVLEMDTEDGFPFAEDLAALARSKDVPVSFFALTSVAKQFPEVLQRLSKDHEIGFHGDVHDGFKGQAAPLQLQRIRTMQADIDQLLGPSPDRVGFRPPKEEYDALTQEVLRNNGIQYDVIDPNSTDARLPFIAKPIDSDPEKSLISLPRTQRDDLNMLAKSRDPVVLENALYEDLDIAVESGGLALLSIHSQNFAPGSPLAQALPRYLDYLNTLRSKLWLTDTGSVARWWRARSRVTVSSIPRGENVEMSMTVRGTTPIDNLVLIVMTPVLGTAPKISALKVGMPSPKIEMMDTLRYRINFPSMPPGNYSYQVTF